VIRLDASVETRPPPTRPATSTDARPEALLTMAGYHGTLAAARSLGRRGIRVVVADGDALAPARWSRHVAAAMDCPPVEAAPTQFIDWLMSLGARQPGRVFCTTSDCVAWLVARHRDRLARHFRIYSPDEECVYTLLNKWRLYQACLDVGVDVPPTWLPAGVEDLARVQREARFPVVIKPKTQVLLLPYQQKGRVVESAAALHAAYGEFVSRVDHSPLLRQYDPQVAAPIVQTFVDTAHNGVYGLSGFVDERGELLAVRASRKVAQWPPRLGVGLCFEDVEVRPSLAVDVARLCRHTGYFGPFEAEFVHSDGRYQLIDFNPRFFGQIGFDVSRGSDVPYLVYLAATGNRGELERAAREARRGRDSAAARVYCNRIDLEITLQLRRWAGRVSQEDCERWRRWLASHRVLDAVIDRQDWAPSLAEATGALVRRAIHPRSTWRFARER
jgi:D-aspartate ligase